MANTMELNAMIFGNDFVVEFDSLPIDCTDKLASSTHLTFQVPRLPSIM